MKPDGLYIGKIHTFQSIIKIIDGQIHVLDRSSKGFLWVGTIMELSRLKKFRPITTEDLVDMICPAR